YDFNDAIEGVRFAKDMINYADYMEKQLKLYGVGSSTFKIAISDRFCTYDFNIVLPKNTCIRDISKRLYASFGLKEEQGKLRE
ncbi:MAG: hypothetical protein GY739_13420, partial [Mesoflavibacter sp.]|nr:hypothetical protein [Mesoflavibacter sp.]